MDERSRRTKDQKLAHDAGFDAIKLKIGRPGLEGVEHVSAVRELAGNDMVVKIDTNQGWDFPAAVANLTAVADLDLQYSKRPLVAWHACGEPWRCRFAWAKACFATRARRSSSRFPLLP